MHHVVLTVLVALTQLAARHRAPAADREVARALAAVASSAATRGDVVAQFSLGSILYYGRGRHRAGDRVVPQGGGAAVRARRIPDGSALRLRIRRRSERSARPSTWYRRAAEHGQRCRQRAVGDFYQKGRGVAADAAEAARWYRRAADGGRHPRAVSARSALLRRHRRAARLRVRVPLVLAGGRHRRRSWTTAKGCSSSATSPPRG